MPFINIETPGSMRAAARPASGRTAAGRPAPLVGREREQALIDLLLAGARRGESGSLVVRGEPGIGKSALLEYAADRAGDMVVLTTAGVEAEADLAFAGLYGLLRPILEHLYGLPAIQSSTLAGALGLGPSSGTERFLVSAAVLGLLAEAADHQPLLCLVDDAQWLDRPSTDALLFCARRLEAEGVVLLFAARDGEPPSFDAPGLADLRRLPMHVGNVCGGGFEQGKPRAEVVRRGPRRQAGVIVDLAVCHAADAGVGEDVDCDIENPLASFWVRRHQDLYRSRQNIVRNAGYTTHKSR